MIIIIEGKGKIIWNNGERYEGYLKNGSPDGERNLLLE